MEFTLRKLWKIEKLREDLDSSCNKEETRVLWAVSTQHRSIHFSYWSAARDIPKWDSEWPWSVFIGPCVSSVMHMVWASCDFTICCHSVYELWEPCILFPRLSHLWSAPLLLSFSLHGLSYLSSTTIKWKVLEINISYVLNCLLFWIA